jgi:hypothetical protein
VLDLMLLSRRRFVALAATAPLLVPRVALAAPDDYEAVGGHFFGQTSFGISDADGASFWSTLKALGGAEAIGFPTSRRFSWLGRPTQLFQRALLQYEPLEKRIVVLNVMDLLHDAGRDEWLHRARSVPRQLPPEFDAGKEWPAVVASRQALLEAQPRLREAYFRVSDPITRYGLPTSNVEEFGGHYAVRLQRAVLQLWKEDTPWARAGDVTEALVGDIARDTGLFGRPDGPPFAAETAWEPLPPPPEPPKPVLPPVIRPPTIGPGERWISVNIGRQWLTLMQGDTPVHGAGVTTGKPGFPTPRGTFRIFSRVFNETMDSLSTGIPRNAPEGYYLKDIFFTQYFADGGYALHSNYWQPASVFGVRPTSHGCVGMRQADAQVVWNFAGIGTKVYVH